MKLVVSDWKKAPKWLSVQASVIGAAVAATWTAMTPEQQESLLSFIGVPPGAIVAAMFVAVVIGRLVAQPGIDAVEPSDE